MFTYYMFTRSGALSTTDNLNLLITFTIWIFFNYEFFWTSLKYKKYLIWPIKYIKHYKSIEYIKRTMLSINMIGNEKQKMW